MLRSKLLLTTLTLMTSAACSGASVEDDTTTSPQEHASVDSPERSKLDPVDITEEVTTPDGEVIQTVEVGPEQVTFVAFPRDGGTEGFMMAWSRPNWMERHAVEVIEQSAGQELTPLEVLSAFSPETEPNSMLVDDHLARTQALGRPDPSLIQVQFQQQETIEKAWTFQGCRDATMDGDVFAVFGSANVVWGDLCTAIQPQGACHQWVSNTSKHRIGVCSNVGGTLTVARGTHAETSSWGTAQRSVPANTSLLWTYSPPLKSDLSGWVSSKMGILADSDFTPGSNFHILLSPTP